MMAYIEQHAVLLFHDETHFLDLGSESVDAGATRTLYSVQRPPLQHAIRDTHICDDPQRPGTITARNLADERRLYASGAWSSGNLSTMDFTPCARANAMHSSLSMACPTVHPRIDKRFCNNKAARRARIR